MTDYEYELAVLHENAVYEAVAERRRFSWLATRLEAPL